MRLTGINNLLKVPLNGLLLYYRFNKIKNLNLTEDLTTVSMIMPIRFKNHRLPLNHQYTIVY